MKWEKSLTTRHATNKIKMKKVREQKKNTQNDGKEWERKKENEKFVKRWTVDVYESFAFRCRTYPYLQLYTKKK